ncbi:MAG: hypothetical protein JOY62_05215 [Acidobacteriaceae bacterium]|nr:hypothetical protein [Acidobacteriaceae bacterium]MBV9779355.1 hypothetical protein [Acidobacteriaceae bacterium]
MGSYLQQYGAEDERRIRIITRIVVGVIAAIVLAVAAYLFFHNFPEKQKINHFLAEINKHHYEAAYRDWGCTSSHPCRDYDYDRFMRDWGVSVSSPWKIASVDGCKTFVTINVQASGAELQSLMVERSTRVMGFAPAPECQEKEWHWREFFHRIFGGS